MKDLKKKFWKLFKNTWPYLLILVLVGVFFWKVILKGLVPLPADFIVGVYYPWLDYKWGYTTGVPVKNPMTTDVVSLIYPEQMLSVDLIKQSVWPLWNRYILAGTPLFANLQAAPFSPTNFVYFIFDKVNAWSVQIILQHVLAVIFMFILLRSWKVSNLGSVFGGMVYSFSGFNLIFSQWNGHTLSSAFIPLIIYFVDGILTKKVRFGYFAGLCLALSLQLLSGYPQVCFYTAIAIVTFYLIKVWKNPKMVLSRTIFLVTSGVVALGISAFQLFPSVELWGLSQRSFEPHPFEWAFLPWKKIITFISADYFGNHATQNYWGPQDYTSNTAYIGVVSFMLASLGLRFLKKKKEVLFLVSLAIVSLVLSFATPISVFLWKNDIFGLRAASAHRATILFIFAASALAAYGLDSLKMKIKSKKYLLCVILVPGVLIFLFGAYALTLKGQLTHAIPATKVALRNLVLPSGVFIASALVILSRLKYKLRILLFAFCLFELFRFGWKFTPFSPKNLIFPDTPVLTFLKSQETPFRVTGNKVIPVNLRTPYALESLEGYETIHPLRISLFIAALNSGKSGINPVGRYGIVDNDVSPLLDLVNTKYYLTHKFDEKGNPSANGNISKRFISDRFKLAFEDGSVAVLESRSVLPRMFRVNKWEVEKDGNKILNKLLDPNFPVSEKIILEEDPGEVDSFMFVSDAFYPGWKAYVDGKETKIYRADFAFRAIPVSSGEHEISMLYHPESFYLGLKITALSLGVLGIYLAYSLKHARK
ncbi:YfhO family protein [Patescibacteria group bacterium]